MAKEREKDGRRALLFECSEQSAVSRSSPRKGLSTYVGMKTLLSAVPLCRLFPGWTRGGFRGFALWTAATTSNSLVERFPASRMEFAALSSTSA